MIGRHRWLRGDPGPLGNARDRRPGTGSGRPLGQTVRPGFVWMHPRSPSNPSSHLAANAVVIAIERVRVRREHSEVHVRSDVQPDDATRARSHEGRRPAAELRLCCAATGQNSNNRPKGLGTERRCVFMQDIEGSLVRVRASFASTLGG